MQMPFGKHAGKELADIPRAYLVWALENLELQPSGHGAALQVQKRQ